MHCYHQRVILVEPLLHPRVFFITMHKACYQSSLTLLSGYIPAMVQMLLFVLVKHGYEAVQSLLHLDLSSIALHFWNELQERDHYLDLVNLLLMHCHLVIPRCVKLLNMFECYLLYCFYQALSDCCFVYLLASKYMLWSCCY